MRDRVGWRDPTVPSRSHAPDASGSAGAPSVARCERAGRGGAPWRSAERGVDPRGRGRTRAEPCGAAVRAVGGGYRGHVCVSLGPRRVPAHTPAGPATARHSRDAEACGCGGPSSLHGGGVMCCTTADPCRRCGLWGRYAAGVPVADLEPCVWCEDEWPPAVLDERTRLCPACRLDIVDRQVAEARASGPPEGVEEARRRAQERRRREFEEARARL